MSKFSYVIQVKGIESEGWEDVNEFPANRYSDAFHEWEDGYLACTRTGCDHQWRVIARIQPCANAPLDQVCQYSSGFEPGQNPCDAVAVADAPGLGGHWGYWCREHLTERRPHLINVISAEPIELVMVGDD